MTVKPFKTLVISGGSWVKILVELIF